MPVLDSILLLLNKNNIQYQKLEHSPVHTSEEAAKIRGTDLAMGAKALVCFANRNPVLIVIPGDQKLDFKKFKLAFKIKDLRMATSDEVKQITTLEIGSIPPLGSVLNIKSYYDNSFKSKEKSVFNAGQHTVSIIMNTRDLILLEQPEFGDIVM